MSNEQAVEKDERLIILDTETTGIDPKEGHRIIEIGCVEVVNRRLTGNHFHVYINLSACLYTLTLCLFV